MSNPDRVELRSQSSLIPENPRKNSHIPSWARTSVFAVRTFLTVLTATPSMVVAADTINRIQNPPVVYAAGDNCENTKLHFIGISFADDPMAKYDNSNRYTSRDSLDPGDIWIGSPQFGQVVIQYRERSNNPKEEVGRFNMVNNGTYSLARIRLAGLNPNETLITESNKLSGITNPSLIVEFYFDDNSEMTEKIIGYRFYSKDHKIQQVTASSSREQRTRWVWIPCGDTFLFTIGRLATDEEIQKAINNPNFVFKRWRDTIDDFIRSEFHGFSFDSSWNKYSNNYPPFSQENYPPLSQEDTRQALKQYLEDKKRKAAIPTNTSGPEQRSAARATEIAKLEAAIADELKEQERERQEKEQDKQIADLKATATALRQPTNTPVPVQLTVAAIILTVYPSEKETNSKRVQVVREMLEKNKAATATAEAQPTNTFTPRPPTSTPVPEIRPTQVVPIGRPTPPIGILDWLWGLGVVSVAGFAAFAYWGYERGRGKQKNPPSPPPPPPSPPPFPRSGGSNPNTSPNIAPNLGPNAAGGNPNTSPNTAASTGPAQPKDAEWMSGQQEFEKKWQDVKSKLLPIRPGDSADGYEYVLDRFKTGMDIVHDVSLNNTLRVPLMATRVRAGIEYLIPQIWSDNNRILKIKRFFDRGFNAGYLTVEDMARIIYLPEDIRSLSTFNEAQTKDISRIRRIIITALHPDTAKNDADSKLKDAVDELLKQFNPAWSYIDRLIK